ncbi:hypothetical protein FQN57_004981 [Myotisia sp. PD_48]|nr:hypothetical protein FQN57_004981 [Myotisia sp. PD_48]
MSLLRHGSSFLQRRLTKLYTDTKSSCESITAESRPNNDPELVSLNLHFRTQKDRLLAWGLDWSDASAAQPNDIDEALAEAGFSDVVASVMSSIQKLLNEAERLQHPNSAKSPDSLGSKAATGGHYVSPGAAGGVKTVWTNEEIARSKVLLEELTSHIDTLYDLSESRRDMTMNMSSANASPLPQSKGSPHLIYPDSSLKRSRQRTLKQPKFSSDKTTYTDQPVQNPTSHKIGMELGLSRKEFYLDRAAIKLSKDAIPNMACPPPYEAVAASSSSRATGYINSSAISSKLTRNLQGDSIPILVEFLPIMMEAQNSLALPRRHRLEFISQTLDRLIENSRVSHLGLLRFVGYYVDMTYSCYAFVYQIPTDEFPLMQQPSSTTQPRTLVSLLHTGEDRQEIPVPNLEDRFSLAYSLVLAALHLRSQNLVHGNINSNNVIIFPGVHVSNTGSMSSPSSDFRRPYLSSLATFDGEDKNTSPEPLSSSIYRHPDDRRTHSDQSGWAYDLYSLGLVLLEVGLWTPIRRLWKIKYDNAMFKSRIENVYVKKLAAKCGGTYQQVVQLCLDAPNFHLSPEPMTDLCLRIPQTYHYPWHDPTKSNDWDTFSKDFLYTIGKILWRCCGLDIVSPPPATDLEESLPPPLSLEMELSSIHEIDATDFGRNVVEPTVSIDPPDEANTFSGVTKFPEKLDSSEKQAKKRTLKKWANIEIPNEHLQVWNKSMMPKLSKLLQKILKESPESCSANLIIAGETAETAKPTICVTCTNIRKVRAALKKYFEYDRENWDLIVIRGDIKRSKVPRRRRRKTKTSKEPIPTEPAATQLNSNYQRRPVCGASIGAFRYDEHLPPVSYGGAILVDDVPYGLTVHHMLDAPCDDDENVQDDYDAEGDYPPRSSGNRTMNQQMSNLDAAYSWCEEGPPESHYAYEISDGDDDDAQSIAHSLDDTYEDHWLSDGYSTDGDDYGALDDDDDDTASIGDTMGVEPGEEPRVIVTQPAIDDVDENFFPSLEDRDDEHLASHSLGYVHASSGVRRWTRDGIKHEVDWALIKIDLERMEAQNIVPLAPEQPTQTGTCYHRNDRNTTGTLMFKPLTKVAKLDDLGGSQVQCCGRTSGFQSGRISKAMTLVKMHGRQSFSTSFSVDGKFGVPGDSGAWVFNNNGQVCGQVLAWSEKNHIAYIAPMEIILNDIARTLNARSVKLPGGEEIISCFSASNDELTASPPYTVSSSENISIANEHLPIELEKLSLDLDDSTCPGRVGTVRNLKQVPGNKYRATASSLISHSRPLERPVA